MYSMNIENFSIYQSYNSRIYLMSKPINYIISMLHVTFTTHTATLRAINLKIWQLNHVAEIVDGAVP